MIQLLGCEEGKRKAGREGGLNCGKSQGWGGNAHCPLATQRKRIHSKLVLPTDLQAGLNFHRAIRKWALFSALDFGITCFGDRKEIHIINSRGAECQDSSTGFLHLVMIGLQSGLSTLQHVFVLLYIL